MFDPLYQSVISHITWRLLLGLINLYILFPAKSLKLIWWSGPIIYMVLMVIIVNYSIISFIHWNSGHPTSWKFRCLDTRGKKFEYIFFNYFHAEYFKEMQVSATQKTWYQAKNRWCGTKMINQSISWFCMLIISNVSRFHILYITVSVSCTIAFIQPRLLRVFTAYGNLY